MIRWHCMAARRDTRLLPGKPARDPAICKQKKMRRFLSTVSTIAPFLQRSPVIPQNAWIHPSAIVEGDVELGEHVSVWPLTTIRGDVNQIKIGKKSNIQDGCVLHVRGHYEGRQVGHGLWIGESVSVGHKACLHACTIESGSLVGIGSIVLDGAVVKKGTLVAAGALIPPGKICETGLWAGCPAKRFP
jgi:carbonic anhydrase/acetyltransferase-like protein (isoleucine patch superfamily)